MDITVTVYAALILLFIDVLSILFYNNTVNLIKCDTEVMLLHEILSALNTGVEFTTLESFHGGSYFIPCLIL